MRKAGRAAARNSKNSLGMSTKTHKSIANLNSLPDRVGHKSNNMKYLFISDSIKVQGDFLSRLLQIEFAGLSVSHWDADYKLPDTESKTPGMIIHHITKRNSDLVAGKMRFFHEDTHCVYISYPLDEEKEARLAHELNVINLDVEEEETIAKRINSIRKLISKAMADNSRKSMLPWGDLAAYMAQYHNLFLDEEQLHEITKIVLDNHPGKPGDHEIEAMSERLDEAVDLLTALWSKPRTEIFERIGRSKHIVESVSEKLFNRTY